MTDRGTASGPMHISGDMPALLAQIAKAREAQQRYLAEHPEEAERIRTLQEERGRRDQLSDLLRRGVPRLEAEATVDGVDEKGVALFLSDAEAWLRACMSTGARLACLAGHVGTGKTLAAVRWFAEQEDPWRRYVWARDVWALSNKFERDRRQLQDLERVDLLLVDEAGHKDESAAESARLAAFLHRRWESKRTTVLIANLSRDQLEKKYGAALASRMWESGGVHICKQVLRAGEKRRQAKGRTNNGTK